MLPPPSPSLALSVIFQEPERRAASQEPGAALNRECENRGLRGGGDCGGGAAGPVTTPQAARWAGGGGAPPAPRLRAPPLDPPTP